MKLDAKTLSLTVGCLTVMGLTGCGGSSGADLLGQKSLGADEGSPSQGFYMGQSNEGRNVSVMVLENDDVWMMHEASSDVLNLVQGAATSAEGTITATGLKYYRQSGGVGEASLQATYTVGSAMAGVIQVQGENGAGFAVSAVSPANGWTYDYNSPAQLADVQGHWLGGIYPDQPIDFTVTAEGALSGQLTGVDCVFSGRLVPRASGKNVLDVEMSFASSAGCGDLANQSGTGIGTLTQQQGQFLMQTVFPAVEKGVVFMAYWPG